MGGEAKVNERTVKIDAWQFVKTDLYLSREAFDDLILNWDELRLSDHAFAARLMTDEAFRERYLACLEKKRGV